MLEIKRQYFFSKACLILDSEAGVVLCGNVTAVSTKKSQLELALTRLQLISLSVALSLTSFHSFSMKVGMVLLDPGLLMVN